MVVGLLENLLRIMHHLYTRSVELLPELKTSSDCIGGNQNNVNSGLSV